MYIFVCGGFLTWHRWAALSLRPKRMMVPLTSRETITRFGPRAESDQRCHCRQAVKCINNGEGCVCNTVDMERGFHCIWSCNGGCAVV